MEIHYGQGPGDIAGGGGAEESQAKHPYNYYR